MELGRHAAGLEMWRCRGMEIWSLGGACCGPADVVVYCKGADVEAQRYGALEVRCRRNDIEVFASKALEVRRRCRYV